MGGSSAVTSVCDLPKDPGPCDAAVWSFAFDSVSGVCVPFVYGGCSGNANRFATAEECYAACSGRGARDYASCDTASDCVFYGLGCCPGCAASSRFDLVAFNNSSFNDWFASKCTGARNCPACPDFPAQRFWASCDSGHCIANDLQESPLGACSQSSDCVLRNDLNCCERCSASGAPSVVNANLASATLCQDTGVPCPDCVPQHEPNTVPVCVNSRCAVAHLTY